MEDRKSPIMIWVAIGGIIAFLGLIVLSVVSYTKVTASTPSTARTNQMAAPLGLPTPAPPVADIVDYCGVCLVGIPKFNKVMGVAFEDHTEFARSRGNPTIGYSYSVPVEEYERLEISPSWRRLFYCDTPEFYAFRHANQLGVPGHLSKCARAWPAPNMSLIAVPNHDWHRPPDASWSNRLP